MSPEPLGRSKFKNIVQNWSREKREFNKGLCLNNWSELGERTLVWDVWQCITKRWDRSSWGKDISRNKLYDVAVSLSIAGCFILKKQITGSRLFCCIMNLWAPRSDCNPPEGKSSCLAINAPISTNIVRVYLFVEFQYFRWPYIIHIRSRHACCSGEVYILHCHLGSIWYALPDHFKCIISTTSSFYMTNGSLGRW